MAVGLLASEVAATAAPGDLDPVFVAGIGAGITPESYPTFDSGTGAVNAVALQSDGKILALDETFTTSGLGGSARSLIKITVQNDGKIYIGGMFTSFSDGDAGRILRLNGDFGSIQFEHSAITVNEHDGNVTVRVNRLFGSRGPVSVEFLRDSGNAVVGTDFTGTTSGTLTWADGDTTCRSVRTAACGNFG